MKGIEFLKENIEVFNTLHSGFIKNLNEPLLKGFEKVYKENIDRNFTLIYWCQSCVFDMMKRLWQWYRDENDRAILKNIININTSSAKKGKHKGVKK